MSVLLAFAKRMLRFALRPLKAVVKPLVRSFIRRLSTRFADDITPLQDLLQQVDELSQRQDRQEGFHWDHAALARRLAVIEDKLEKLLQQQPAAEDLGSAEEPADLRPVIRLAPSEPERAGPLVHERVYRWEKTG
ncbi:MAG TPA: hypothetical protein VHC19_16080 [Pirellulales bacterium]|nr:hypothetical protein [Pirellulales bacterium]